MKETMNWEFLATIAYTLKKEDPIFLPGRIKSRTQ